VNTFDHFEELGSRACLFLEELLDLGSNGLRIAVIEGIPSKVPTAIEIAGQSLGNGFPVRANDESVKYELTWPSYVLYQVTNECFGQKEVSQDGLLTQLAGVYRSSALLEHVSRATIASDEYPGRLTHYRVICSDHIIDVVSAEQPRCQRIGPKLKVN
jgi:hypothetical protein